MKNIITITSLTFLLLSFSNCAKDPLYASQCWENAYLADFGTYINASDFHGIKEMGIHHEWTDCRVLLKNTDTGVPLFVDDHADLTELRFKDSDYEQFDELTFYAHVGVVYFTGYITRIQDYYHIEEESNYCDHSD